MSTALAILFCAQYPSAQKCVNPNFEAHRLDFRDLGYPAATEIPAASSPVAALLSHSNGRIYGATTGKQSHLFSYDFLTNKVYPLGKIPGAEGVHHSIAEGKDGLIYIGSGRNQLELLALTGEIPHGRRMIEYQLWNDIKSHYTDFDGGHLFIYNPAEGDGRVYLPEDTAGVTDLGIPVKGNSIYAMTLDCDRNKIYGISYPDAVFFEYDIAAGTFRQYGEWLKKKAYSGPERSWRSVPRSLVCTRDGRVYSSGNDGLMHYFDTETGKIVRTGMRIPGEYWETQNYDGYPVAEQFVAQDSCTIYGSSSDGFIFKMTPAEDKLAVLGKPRVERRVRAMTLGKDGQLYMICGEKDNVCRMFSYDTQNGEGFLDYGVLGVDRSPYYAKIAYQFDAMCTGQDGTIFIGESDHRAKLFFYVPGGNIVKGSLNPTNPR
jgi:hypothetical protein